MGLDPSSSTDRARRRNPRRLAHLYFQNENPGKDNEANWLPAAKGAFNLTMRIYGPKSEELIGKLNPPPVTRVQAVPNIVGQ